MAECISSLKGKPVASRHNNNVQSIPKYFIIIGPKKNAFVEENYYLNIIKTNVHQFFV